MIANSPTPVIAGTPAKDRVSSHRPIADAAPTISVIAVSKEVKCPLMSVVHPARYSQMTVMSTSQKAKIGAVNHPTALEPRMPSARPIHKGAVWTT